MSEPDRCPLTGRRHLSGPACAALAAAYHALARARSRAESAAAAIDAEAAPDAEDARADVEGVRHGLAAADWLLEVLGETVSSVLPGGVGHWPEEGGRPS